MREHIERTKPTETRAVRQVADLTALGLELDRISPGTLVCAVYPCGLGRAVRQGLGTALADSKVSPKVVQSILRHPHLQTTSGTDLRRGKSESCPRGGESSAATSPQQPASSLGNSFTRNHFWGAIRVCVRNTRRAVSADSVFQKGLGYGGFTRKPAAHVSTRAVIKVRSVNRQGLVYFATIWSGMP